MDVRRGIFAEKWKFHRKCSIERNLQHQTNCRDNHKVFQNLRKTTLNPREITSKMSDLVALEARRDWIFTQASNDFVKNVSGCLKDHSNHEATSRNAILYCYGLGIMVFIFTTIGNHRMSNRKTLVNIGSDYTLNCYNL